MTAEAALYFEDIVVGTELRTPGLTLTRTHAVMFAGLTGERPEDPGAIHDLLPLAISSGLGWRLPMLPMIVLAFMGLEWRFHAGARVGDTIHVVTRAAAKRQMKDGGVLVEERRLVNQRGEVIQSGRATMLVARRTVAAPAGGP